MHVCLITNLAANESLNYAIPLQVLDGATPDISPILQFDFYEPVYYKAYESSFPSESVEKAGRFVGISETVGHALTYKILTDDTKKIIHRSVVRSALDTTRLNNRAVPNLETEPHPHLRSRLDDLIEEQNEDSQGELVGNKVSMPIIHPEELIGKTFLFPQEDGQVHRATIIEAIKDHEYLTENNPNFLKFKCSINDDLYEEVLAYHQILEYLEKATDNPILWKFKRIVAHQGPLDASSPDYKGSMYNVQIEWENGEVTYEPLGVIAADDPVTCAIYARDHNLLNTSGWKRFRSLAKRQKKLFRMINQAKLRSFRTAPRYKYGFEIPKNYKHAVEIDHRNGNKRWQDATELEMGTMDNYQVFEDYGKGAPIPQGYKQIRVHLIFDVKHDGRHKARLVAGGHLTEVPLESVYSGVVSLRGLRMFLFIAELNNLQVWGTDITSAYLEAFTDEKVCIIAGPEFGKLEGHLLVICKALYGLRSSGARWHERLADCLRNEGFLPCRAEPDIWMRPSDGIYEYIAVYVDDLAIAMHNPSEFTNVLSSKYNFSMKGTGPLKFHLGADFVRDNKGTLSMAPRKYIDRMIASYERMFGEKPKINVYSPLEPGDHPELDDSQLPDATGTQQYLTLVGMLQWAISLGRFDIATAVMSMSSFHAAPCCGHLN